MKNILLLALMLLSMSAFSQSRTKENFHLKQNFVCPPESTKPGIYWYWMNEHVSKEGITKDLESLYNKGIGEVYIGNICDGGALGNVKTLSPEWLECMRHAIREGTRIGINVGLFNSPGWSQSGGPWVKPEDAMRYLVYSEISVSGPAIINRKIEKPKDFFQDVVVLAYPETIEETSQKATVTSNPSASNLEHLTDSDLNTITTFNNETRVEIQVDINYDQPETKRSLYIKPGDLPFGMYCDVYMKQGNDYVLVKSHYFDRIKRVVRMGADPSAPLALSLGEINATSFRIVMKDLPKNFQLRELNLSSKPLLENYPEKWLIKMPSKATPNWHAHIWKNQEQPSMEGIVANEQVRNISQYMIGDTLRWKAPAGKWKIVRVGMTTTNTTNQPAAPVARGLEIDKMNKRVIAGHYDAYVGQITKGMSKEDLKSFTRVIADSYETGPVNWTDEMAPVFVKRYGYDPYPWLAVLTGQIVGSADQSNRFLWDLRRLVAERVASEYVGGMKEICEKNGVQLWLENYGWDGFPSEFILYSKFAPAIGGEFWTNNVGDNPECRLAASGCHMYGKNRVYAESYTTRSESFEYYPAKLKKHGDKSYTEGVNQHILHLCIHQPYDDKKVPGVNAWFGIEYNRYNTWFENSKAWIDYQRRCCFMLQQGRHHADVCFFISEESPKMSGWVDKSLAKGYDYDFINSDVIINSITVENGKLALPSGINYSLLVLPPLNTMRPEVLKRIKELVEQGAKVLGSPIESSPSLANYPKSDKAVQKLSLAIWGTDNYNTQDRIERTIGKGQVFCNVPINDVLAKINVPEAVAFAQAIPVLWKQRTLENSKIFFLCNQEDETVSFDALFNVTGYQPELWNPVDGTTRDLPDFEFASGKTKVPLRLAGSESCFIVFKKQTKSPDIKNAGKGNYSEDKIILALDDRWDIDFYNRWTGEKFELRQHTLEDWAKSENNQIKHFSGEIIYKNEFDLPEAPSGENVYLDFETLYETAAISINGKPAEQEIWCKPYRVNISSLLQKGSNKIEIRVTNSWKNKMLEQAQKPKKERTIYYNFFYDFYVKKPELSPSGIWGDVKIITCSSE